MSRPTITFTRGAALPALLQQRIVIIDGAMGTMIRATTTPSLAWIRLRRWSMCWRSAERAVPQRATFPTYMIGTPFTALYPGGRGPGDHRPRPADHAEVPTLSFVVYKELLRSAARPPLTWR